MTTRHDLQAQGRPFINYAVRGAGILVLAITGWVLIAKRVSDGPLTAMIPGGTLRAGALVADAEVDWEAVLGGGGACAHGDCAPMKPVELQLVDPPTSRYVGVMVRDGELYVPCDLGFMWGRFSGTNRWMLHLIYVFKRWHQDALRDGRVVLRIDGTRYAGKAVRVTDPELLAALRAQLEDMARHWVAPDVLAPPPTEGPNDIWFFRIDPRRVSSQSLAEPRGRRSTRPAETVRVSVRT